MDEWEMIQAVAREYEIVLPRMYSEAEAAYFLRVDISTLKRWRYKGKVKTHKPHGPRKIRYMGLHIVKMIIEGIPR